MTTRMDTGFRIAVWSGSLLISVLYVGLVAFRPPLSGLSLSLLCACLALTVALAVVEWSFVSAFRREVDAAVPGALEEHRVVGGMSVWNLARLLAVTSDPTVLGHPSLASAISRMRAVVLSSYVIFGALVCGFVIASVRLAVLLLLT